MQELRLETFNVLIGFLLSCVKLFQRPFEVTDALAHVRFL